MKIFDYVSGETYRAELAARVRAETQRDDAQREASTLIEQLDKERNGRDAEREAHRGQLLDLLNRFAPNPSELAAAAASLETPNVGGLNTKEQLELVKRSRAVGRTQIDEKRKEIARLEGQLRAEATGIPDDAQKGLSPGEIARVDVEVAK